MLYQNKRKWMKFDGNRWIENEETWSLRKLYLKKLLVYQVVANMSFV